MQFISKLIPREYHSVPKLYRRVYLVTVLNSTILFFSVLYAGLFYLLGFQEGVIILSYSCLAMLGFFVLIRQTNNHVYTGAYFASQSLIISTALMTFTGGVVSPFTLWLFGISPVSFLYFKEKHAIISSTITFIVFLIFVGLQMFGYEMTHDLGPGLYYSLWAFMFLFVTLIYISMVKGFQSGLKKMNYKLKTSNHKLKVSNEELERFAYIASHDLKSPLRNITSFTSLIERRFFDQLSGDGQDYFRIISDNARHMNNLIEDILEFSQVNVQTIKKEDVDLNIVVQEIADILMPLYKNANVYFEVLPTVKTDYVRIKQVFQNLIENGLKYNQSGSPEICITFEQNEDGLLFKVIDNGIGIEEEYHQQIFKMFERLHNQSEFQGTGIGLAVCKKVVHYLGGEIEISSNDGQQGSTFQMLLPNNIFVGMTEEALLC